MEDKPSSSQTTESSQAPKDKGRMEDTHLLEEDVADNTGPQDLKRYTLEDLKMLTSNFAFKCPGGANPVYEGILPNGEMLAVKKYANKDTESDRGQWKAEIECLPKFDCLNIITLKGKAVTNKSLYVIYPWLDNGDLNQNIKDLDWQQTLKILRGCAVAMNQLHSQDLIYRDLKASNVLLDKDWNPVLGDFGTVGDINRNIRAGTIGHVDFRAWQVKASKFTDMYSFGVLMLQLMMKIKDNDVYGDDCPIKAINNTSQDHISGWVCELYKAKENVVASDLTNTGCTPDQANWIVLLALKCMFTSFHRRPTIGEMLERLNELPNTEDPTIAIKKLEKVVNKRLKIKEDESPEELEDDDPLMELPATFHHPHILSGSTDTTISPVGQEEDGSEDKGSRSEGEAKEKASASTLQNPEEEEEIKSISMASMLQQSPEEEVGSTSMLQKSPEKEMPQKPEDEGGERGRGQVQQKSKWDLILGCMSCKRAPSP